MITHSPPTKLHRIYAHGAESSSERAGEVSAYEMKSEAVQQHLLVLSVTALGGGGG